MILNNKKGFFIERNLKKKLNKLGYFCFRITKSLYGDLILKSKKKLILIELKFYKKNYYPSKHKNRYTEMKKLIFVNFEIYIGIKFNNFELHFIKFENFLNFKKISKEIILSNNFFFFNFSQFEKII